MDQADERGAVHDWTGEDRRYALAAAMTSLLIAILVAYNFGLVTPDLLGLDRAEVPDIRITELAAVTGQQGSDAGTAGQVLGTFVSRPQTPARPVPAPPIRPADSVAPTSSITTEDGTLVSSVSSGPVTGIASDDDSGVDRVSVTFRPLAGDPVERPAQMACTGPDRRVCTWSVSPPQPVGTYSVSSRATDAAGNIEPDPRPTRSITVVSPTGEPEDTGGGVVQETVGLLGGVVRTLGGLLGL